MKKFEVRFLAEAIDDLDALYSYIAKQSSFEIADGYLARIERLCFSLQSFPQRGTAVAGDIAGLRTMGFVRWPRLFGQFSPIFKWKFCFFGLGCQRFWQAVEVDRVGDVSIVPVSID